MNTQMNRHLSIDDRRAIENLINCNCNFTKISNIIKKHRATISREVRNHVFLRTTCNCNNQPYCFESNFYIQHIEKKQLLCLYKIIIYS